MSHMKAAMEVIAEVNKKFSAGCANQPTGPFDKNMTIREHILDGTAGQLQSLRDQGQTERTTSLRTDLAAYTDPRKVIGIRVEDPNGQVILRMPTPRVQTKLRGEW